MRISLSFGAAVAFLFAGDAVKAGECTMPQMLSSASSVVDPCTRLIDDAKLPETRRAEAHLIRGRAYHRSRRLEQAAADYEAASQLTPNNTAIWLSWSDLDLWRKDYEGYVAKVKTAVDLEPDNPRVINLLGRVHRNFGDQDGEIKLYTRMLERGSDRAYALLFRSQAYQAHRKFAEAITDADALIALPPEVLKRDGHVDGNGTVRDFLTVALVHLGELLAGTGQTERARKDLDAAVDRGRSATALVARAVFLLMRDNTSQQALGDLIEATKKEPANELGQYNLGIAYIQLGQHEPAFEALSRAIDVVPGYARALKIRARLHRHFERTEKAVEDFMAAIEADPYIVTQSMQTLRHAGYWTSKEDPTSFTPEFQDAIRACMLDPGCS
jgi:tetratricopeptide (TPR) repeat protein